MGLMNFQSRVDFHPMKDWDRLVEFVVAVVDFLEVESQVGHQVEMEVQSEIHGCLDLQVGPGRDFEFETRMRVFCHQRESRRPCRRRRQLAGESRRRDLQPLDLTPGPLLRGPAGGRWYKVPWLLINVCH